MDVCGLSAESSTRIRAATGPFTGINDESGLTEQFAPATVRNPARCRYHSERV